MKFVLGPGADFNTAYSALAALEDYLSLTVATEVTPESTFILTPKNEETARYLSSVKTLYSNKTIELKPLDPSDTTKKCILMRYPLELPLSLLEKQQNVVSA